MLTLALNSHADLSLAPHTLSLLKPQFDAFMPLPHVDVSLICPIENFLEILGLANGSHKEHVAGFFEKFLVVEANGLAVEVVVIEGNHGVEEGEEVDVVFRREESLEVVPTNDVKDAVGFQPG